jgi:hypothetical protein
MDTYDGLHIEGKCMISGYGNQPFDEEWDVDDIPSDRSEAVQVTANGDCRMYRDGDTLKFYNTATSGVIDSLEGAKADAPYIIGEYGKIEGEWCNFPGYSETVLWSGSESISAWANPFTVPNVTLDILDEYDALSFEAYVVEGSDRYPFSGIILTSYVKDNYDTYLQIPIMIAHSHQMAIYPDQANNCFKMYAETNYGYIFKRLVGIKYGNGGANSSVSYSTDEQVVGTWIDGKPLYQKTVEYSSVTANAWNEKLIDSNADFINLEGYLLTTAGHKLPLNYDTGSTYFSAIMGYRSNNTSVQGYLSIYTNASNASSAIVTVRYIKTTD